MLLDVGPFPKMWPQARNGIHGQGGKISTKDANQAWGDLREGFDEADSSKIIRILLRCNHCNQG